MLDKLTIDDFSGRIGETFAATATGGPSLTLTLREAEALYAPPGDQGRTPFSLEFTDPSQEHLPQQTVAIEHPELGSFDLFVVPLGPGPDGMRYQAIFT
jgi:hypothetical protein